MRKSVVTARGQVTIPKAIREYMGIAPGDEIEFVRDGKGVRLRRAGDEPFSEYRGYLKEHPVPSLEGLSSDEIVELMRDR